MNIERNLTLIQPEREQRCFHARDHVVIVVRRARLIRALDATSNVQARHKFLLDLLQILFLQ